MRNSDWKTPFSDYDASFYQRAVPRSEKVTNLEVREEEGLVLGLLWLLPQEKGDKFLHLSVLQRILFPGEAKVTPSKLHHS